VERLVATLRHPLGDRAVHAAATLGAIGDRRAVPALLDALGAPDPYLQAEAARALGTLGDRRAAPALAELARTGSVPGRRAAGDALVALDRGRRP
jgi:HEAT repeat protein